MMDVSTGPRVLAAGERPYATYSHTGYVVGIVERETSYWQPALPSLTWLAVAAAIWLLARRPRGQAGLAVQRRAVAVSGAVLVLPVAALVVLGDASRLTGLSGEGRWMAILAALCLLPLASFLTTAWQHARRPGGATVSGVTGTGCLVLLLLVAGLMSRLHGHSALRPDVLTAMQRTEQLAALTEAEAVRLGRWPTAAEWVAQFGSLARRSGVRYEYHLGELGRWDDRPYRAYSIDGQVAGSAYWDEEALCSAAYGPDGLFGTADDCLDWLPPNRWGQRVWPHGRAPRDPNVKLPPWPEEAKP